MKPRRQSGRHPTYRWLIPTAVIVAVSAFILGIAAKSWLPEDPAEASAERASPPPQTTDSSVTSEVSSQAATANGVEVRVTNVRYQSGSLLVDVCFTLPDAGDWVLYEPTITKAGKSVRWSETIPISLTRAAPDGSIQTITFAPDGSYTVAEPSEPAVLARCDTVAFPGVSERGKTPTLTIPAIVAEPREGEACSADNLARYQEVVSSAFPGVTYRCGTSGHGAVLTVDSIPAGVSSAAIEAFTGTEEFLLDAYGIRGPWTFELPAG